MIALILCIIFVLCMVILIKNQATLNNHLIISRAIYQHNMTLIKRGEYSRFENMVEYSDMESYYKTLFRLWDWGYTRILPPEKMDLIKPYIE